MTWGAEFRYPFLQLTPAFCGEFRPQDVIYISEAPSVLPAPLPSRSSSKPRETNSFQSIFQSLPPSDNNTPYPIMTQLVWLITGCSSGFGEAFVHSILARGDKVIATGRNAGTRLAHLNETGAAILELDVTSPQAELDAKIQDAIKIYGKIDILVNNAGYIEIGLIEELT